MKTFQKLLLITCALSFILPANAAEPVDTIVKNAVADIERFEAQAEGLTPARKSNAKRIAKLMDLSYQRLQTSKNQTDPSWIEVNQRYLKLQTKLETLSNPTATTPATSTATAPTPTVAPTVPATATETTVRPLVSGERVRVKKLTRDMSNVNEAVVTTGPSPMQAPDEVAAYAKRIKQFEEALVRYPQVEDPDVIAARTAYATLKNTLNSEFKRAREQLAALGDVQARLRTIVQNANAYPVPAPLQLPFDQAAAKAWVDAASKARTVAEHNYKELAQIAPLAYLPETRGTPESGAAFDASDVDRLQRNAANTVKQVEGNYASMASALSNQFDQFENSVLTRWQEDPEAEDKRWLFISEGKKAEAFELYDACIAMAESSVHLETALGREPTQARAIIAKMNQAKRNFEEKQTRALSTSRLPKSASTDKKLLSIAKGILENPKYKFGEHAKIILTTDQIVERERKESEIDIDDAEVTLGGDLKMSGTQTTWTYRWQEFKFATALKEDGSDDWYIWWITARNYSSGDNTTPLNQWISGKATQGNRILEKNL